MKSIEGLHVILGGFDFERTRELARIADNEDAAVIQLREKSLPTGEWLCRADAIRQIVTNARFIVNDRADIALACGADGVHLGQDDLPIADARTLLGPHAIIGASAPSVELATQAERHTADYIGFGHMFPTNSKQKTTAPQTIDTLKQVIFAVTIPVIAIGGITLENSSGISVPGLGGVAVIGAIRDAKHPSETIRAFVRRLEERHAFA